MNLLPLFQGTKRAISTARVMLEASVDDVPTLQAAILSGCLPRADVGAEAATVADRIRVLEEIAYAVCIDASNLDWSSVKDGRCLAPAPYDSTRHCDL